jgi:hypothetical protein
MEEQAHQLIRLEREEEQEGGFCFMEGACFLGLVLFLVLMEVLELQLMGVLVVVVVVVEG